MAARMSFTLPSGSVPRQGAVGIPVLFDFTAKDLVSSDLALEQMQGAIDYVQSIFIDNRLNTKAFVIVFSGLQYTIQVRPGRQGIWPVLAANGGLQFTATSPASGIIVPTIMYNTEQPYFFWDV